MLYFIDIDGHYRIQRYQNCIILRKIDQDMDIQVLASLGF